MGQDVVLGNLQIGVWFAAGLLVLWILWLIFKAIFIDVAAQAIREIKAEKEAGKPWLGQFVLLTGLPFAFAWIAGFVSDKCLHTDLLSSH
jgi:hypothetical protein